MPRYLFRLNAIRFNENHGPDGKFASGDGSGGGGGKAGNLDKKLYSKNGGDGGLSSLSANDQDAALTAIETQWTPDGAASGMKDAVTSANSVDAAMAGLAQYFANDILGDTELDNPAAVTKAILADPKIMAYVKDLVAGKGKK